MSVSLSLSMRVLVNLESLNMAESIGNVTRHRRAPVVIEDNGRYRLIYVPVVSGMSLAHHYQVHLAKAASKMGLKVTRMSLLGYFMKFSDDNIIKNHYPEVHGKFNKKNPCEAERTIVSECVVGDIGGFLYTDGLVKRTSRFSFSYLAPTLDSLEDGAAGAYPQLHVRYTPEARKGEQALIYVDNASALYTLSFLLEADKISKLDVCASLGQKPDDLGTAERVKRFEAAVQALIAMLGNLGFGAKRTRSLPHWKVESAVVAAAKGVAPFVASPGHSKDYIQETAKRMARQRDAGSLEEGFIAYYGQGVEAEGSSMATLEEAILEAAEWVRARLLKGG
ncbi:MAG: type I-A CRISPR-associated protein Cas7/Csa2 [Aeropyrum sp.]|nr:type I-A CRISPR-associated protein Cas7/Csa2 [Aeropyrum sp.]MCE4615843.1 type I-A CRISPR-associated protein Cas7/Csa2 [Aeropyrum sp.]